MKNLTLTIYLFLVTLATYACPTCERNQPKLLKGIVHGKGPDSNWDYVSVAITALISLIALYYTIKWLIKPGEKNNQHIKYSILQN